MPNPLLVAATSPNTTAKPDANQRDQRDPKGAIAFQDVMDQEAHPHESGDETTAQSEAELESEALSTAATPTESITDIRDVRTQHPKEEMSEIGAGAETTGPQAYVTPDMPPESLDVEAAQQVPFGIAAHTDIPLRIDGNAHSPSSNQTDTQITGQHMQRVVPIHSTQSATESAGPVHRPPLGETKEPAKNARLVEEVVEPQKMTAAAGAQNAKGQTATSAPPPTLAQMKIFLSERSTPDVEIAATKDAEGLNTVRESSMFQATRETTSGIPPSLMAARADTARAIAGQMAAAINTRTGSGAVEIALNPEELGRVSIVLNGREDGFHMTIAAERPETLDLMRRHIAVLTAEFQKLGYGDLSFDLGTPSDRQRDDTDADKGSPFDAAQVENDIQSDAIIHPTAPDRGLDMRL